MPLPQVEGYVVVEKIGSGSYSSVYKAYKNKGPRDVVAVKCVEKSKLSGSAINNIITEITLLKLLKHEYIVEMKDFLWDNNFIYIIMEYCNAGDLSNFIKKRHKLPEAICKKFLQQLTLALRFLRENNVTHMDLKPQNLLLTTVPQLTLKLADFGFAQFLSPEEHNNSLRGSPLYMAPEILLKRHYDARVDLWSVGVIMYECLFGKAPYSSKSFDELTQKITKQIPIEIPKSAAISNECRDLMLKLLQHDPEKRIDFDSFFNHPFLDLEHAPSPTSLQKAIDLVSQAVTLDSQKKFPEAFNLYCESLRYFIPLINGESDVSKKTALRLKVNNYISRAEELKKITSTKDISSNSDSSFEQQELSSLRRLCSVTPTLITALDIGSNAELYLAEGQYERAFENFQSCLNILVPSLASEPKGIRRDLLHKQVMIWLKMAENAKTLLSVLDVNSDSLAEQKDSCSLQ